MFKPNLKRWIWPGCKHPFEGIRIPALMTLPAASTSCLSPGSSSQSSNLNHVVSVSNGQSLVKENSDLVELLRGTQLITLMLPNKPLWHYCSVTRLAAKIAEWNHPAQQSRLKLGRLTRRKSTTKEHVEEILRWDVSFKSTVEVCVTVSMSGKVDFLISKLVILLPLLWIAQYCICITNGWNSGRKEAVNLFLLVIQSPFLKKFCICKLTGAIT